MFNVYFFVCNATYKLYNLLEISFPIGLSFPKNLFVNGLSGFLLLNGHFIHGSSSATQKWDWNLNVRNVVMLPCVRFEYFNYANMACQTIILQWLQSSLLPADVENKTNDHTGSHIVDHNPLTAPWLYYIIIVLEITIFCSTLFSLNCVVGVWSNYLNNIWYLQTNKDVWKV